MSLQGAGKGVSEFGRALPSQTRTREARECAPGQQLQAESSSPCRPTWGTHKHTQTHILQEFLQDRASSSRSGSPAATAACHGVRWRPRQAIGEHITNHLTWHLTSAKGFGSCVVKHRSQKIPWKHGRAGLAISPPSKMERRCHQKWKSYES
jgi:hypothetical protein